MSPVAGGLSAQLGTADETTYGTIVTPTRFHEFVSEGLKLDIDRIESKGLRPLRRVLSSDDWVPGRTNVDGEITLEVVNKGFGYWLKHMLGNVASTQPNSGTAPTVWEHKGTIGALDGKSFTTQVGRTGVDGNTRAFTYSGCKIDKWSLECDNQGILTAKLSINAANETTATALATASYPASPLVPLVYVGGTITIGGAQVDVTKFSMSSDNNVAKDRFFMRGAANSQTGKEQLEGADLRMPGGQVDAEFTDLTLYNKFVNGTIGQFTAFFAGANIAGAYNYGLEVTCAAIRFDGETPTVDGPGIIDQPLPFKVLDSGATDGPVAVVYRTTDTTP